MMIRVWLFIIGLFLTILHSNPHPFLLYSSVNIDKMVELYASPYDLDRTVRTLIRIESDDGKYLINLQSGDCGLTQINVTTYLKRHKTKDTNFNRNKACMDLINNPTLAIVSAIEELLYWQSIHCIGQCTKEQYRKVVKSYNAGWSYDSQAAEQYWQKFKKVYHKLYGY